MNTQKEKVRNLDSRVHPELKEFFSKMPDFFPMTKEAVHDTRKAFEQFAASIPIPYPDLPITTKNIPGPTGAPEVSVRIYNSQDGATQRPALLWMHGGGYLIGHPKHFDYICVRIAKEADCIVVSPDYRRAPENPYPAAIEDCYATLVWMRDAAQELGINTKKIAIAGQSCGGGLCATLSLLARDRNGPEICLQMPLYPMLDDRHVTPSSHEIVDARVWNRENNSDCWGLYLGDHAKGEISQYAVAARATDYSRLPPTFTFVGELDVLRDETIEYVTNLLQAKVHVDFHIYSGCIHAFDLFVLESKVSETANASIVNALKEAFKY